MALNISSQCINLWGICAFAVLFAVSASNVTPVFIDTRNGKLQGKRTVFKHQDDLDATIDTVDTFFGVPYAKPPTGDLRFQPPQPVTPWNVDVKNATARGPFCPSLNYAVDKPQSEDCLYLDIYTPYEASRPDYQYPVMMFIHGGSYEVNSGRTYDGSVLARFGVTVVFINYRLGPLGFLTAGDDVLPGNYGIKDQIHALKWVKENAASFRGNSNNVTIFGNSAGGSSVCLLLVVPEARDLFHGAICQSGVATADWAFHDGKNRDLARYVRDVALFFNCPDDNIQDIVACLKKVDSAEFVKNREEWPEYYTLYDPDFRPYIDGEFIPVHPLRAYNLGYYYKVPTMVGILNTELSKRPGASLAKLTEKLLDKYLGSDDLISFVKNSYLTWNETSQSVMEGDTLLEDMYFTGPSVQTSDAISKHNDQLYQYFLSPPNSWHGVDLNYIFGTPFSGRYYDGYGLHLGRTGVDDFNQSQRQLSTTVMKMWSNFAKYGNPTSSQNISGLDFQWLPFGNSTEQNYLYISEDTVENRQHLEQSKAILWNKIVPYLKKKYGTTNSKVPGYTSNKYLIVTVLLVLLIVSLIAILTLTCLAYRKTKRYSVNNIS